jgi:hypothetical protein
VISESVPVERKGVYYFFLIFAFSLLGIIQFSSNMAVSSYSDRLTH